MKNDLYLPRFPGQFPLSTDSVLLSDFTVLPENAAVFDLGAGPGTLGLLLCTRHESCRVTGLELQESPAAAASELAAANGLSGRTAVLQGDLRHIEAYAAAGQYDAVVSNPPYFPDGCGIPPATEAQTISRTERCCPLDALTAAAAYLLRWGGGFFLVHRPERLCDLMLALRAARLEPKRLRFVRHRPASPPCLLLLESRLGGKPGLALEPDLLLRGQNGEESEEYRRIYGLGGPT